MTRRLAGPVRRSSVAVRKFARFLGLLRSELPNQSDTLVILWFLVSLWTRSSQKRLLSNHANFGSGTLVFAFAGDGMGSNGMAGAKSKGTVGIIGLGIM